MKYRSLLGLAAILAMAALWPIWEHTANAEELGQEEAARELISLTNLNRTVNGLQALLVDQALKQVSRSRSEDMIARQYFSHYIPPDNHTILNLLQAEQFDFTLAGENIAWNTAADYASVQYANNQFMNSEGHRANILNPRFNLIGAGVASDAVRRMHTVVFVEGTALRPIPEEPTPSFSTSTSPISPPTLASPQDMTRLEGLGTTLGWTNPPGTTQVHGQVLPVNNDGPGVEVYLGTPATSYLLPAPPDWYGLLPDMTYTWRVRASSAVSTVGLDDPSWSRWAEATFRTPKVGSGTIAAVSPSQGSAAASRTPVLRWADSRAAIFYYEVQLSKDATFTTDAASATAMVYGALIHGGVSVPRNSYSVPDGFPLEPHTTYYWRVRPRVQGDGIPIAWSETWRFQTP